MHASTQRKSLLLHITFICPFDLGLYSLSVHETGRVDVYNILFVSWNDVTAVQNSAKIDLDNKL